MSGVVARVPAARRALTTGAVVAGSSLVSRFLALAVLVPAARCLNVGDFGAFVLVIGVSGSVGGVVGSAIADLVASGAVLHPVRTWRRTALCTAALAASGLVGAVCVALVRGDVAVWLTTALLATTGLAPFIVMHLLRGSGRPGLGACLAFVVSPVVRLGAVVVLAASGGGDLRRVLTALLWAAIACALLSCAVVWCDRPSGHRKPETGGPIVAPSPLALVAGVAVAIAFTLVGQAAPLSLSAFLGDPATGRFVPTARVCEAITAVGVGYQFVASRRAVDLSRPQVPVRVVGLLATSFGAATLVVLLVAPWALPVLLGPGHDLDVVVAMALVPAYFCTMMSAAEIQRLFLVRRHQRIVFASVLAAVTTAVCTPVATAWLGADGAAGATAAAALAWWVALRAPHRAPNRSDVTPEMTNTR